MPITRVRTTSCDQVCAACNTERTVDYVSLQAGVHSAVASRTDANSIRFPPCATCGAVEQLIRTWDTHPDPGSHAAKHRGLVNRLFKVLVRKGHAEEHCAPIYAGETTDPPDIAAEDPDDHPDHPIEIGKPPHLQGQGN